MRGDLAEEEAKAIVFSVDYEVEFMINICAFGIFRLIELLLLFVMYQWQKVRSNFSHEKNEMEYDNDSLRTALTRDKQQTVKSLKKIPTGTSE